MMELEATWSTWAEMEFDLAERERDCLELKMWRKARMAALKAENRTAEKKYRRRSYEAAWYDYVREW